MREQICDQKDNKFIVSRYMLKYRFFELALESCGNLAADKMMIFTLLAGLKEYLLSDCIPLTPAPLRD